MIVNQFHRLLAFLRQLEAARIAYQLRHSRDEAVMVEIAVPGERWEVDFLEDGDIEVERFRSHGKIETTEAVLQELFRKFADWQDERAPDPAPELPNAEFWPEAVKPQSQA